MRPSNNGSKLRASRYAENEEDDVGLGVIKTIVDDTYDNGHITGIERRPSTMRMTTAIEENASRMSVKERTIHRRGFFKWLPVCFDNDMKHGSW